MSDGMLSTFTHYKYISTNANNTKRWFSVIRDNLIY